jgi:hypothetical protein
MPCRCLFLYQTPEIGQPVSPPPGCGVMSLFCGQMHREAYALRVVLNGFNHGRHSYDFAVIHSRSIQQPSRVFTIQKLEP